MTSADIITSIQNWDAIRQDSQALIDFFGQGNCFEYDFPAYAGNSAVLHAYPGIYEDELYFFVIPAEFDNKNYGDVIDQYTTACLVVNIVGDNRLMPDVAKARMKAWQKNYTIWTPAQVNGQYGIFEAFVIPTQDCEVENVIMTLALKADAAATASYEAELIVTNDDGKQVVFDDFVNAVPPFNALPAQNNFYLLAAAII